MAVNKAEDIKERFVEVFERLEASGVILSRQEAAKKLDTSPQNLSEIMGKHQKPTVDILRKFFTEYNVNANYIFFGKYPAILSTKVVNASQMSANEPQIPLVTIQAFAGTGNASFRIKETDIQSYYVVPDFKNISFMTRVNGSSMYPKYNSGDVIACRIIKSSSFIQWGKVYVIATKEQGILVKRIKKSKKPDHILAVSDNEKYDPFDIPVSDIEDLALVVGVIRLE